MKGSTDVFELIKSYSPNQWSGHPLENVFHFLDVTIFGFDELRFSVVDETLTQYFNHHPVNPSTHQAFKSAVMDWYYGRVKGSPLSIDALYFEYLGLRRRYFGVLAVSNTASRDDYHIYHGEMLKSKLGSCKRIFVAITQYHSKDVNQLTERLQPYQLDVDWLVTREDHEVFVSHSQVPDEGVKKIIEVDQLMKIDAWILEHKDEYDVGILLGEHFLLQVQGSPMDLFVFAKIRQFYTQVLVSSYDNSGQVLLYLPAHQNMIDHNPIVHASSYNYQLQDWLVKRYGASVFYQSLHELMHMAPGSFYDFFRNQPTFNEHLRIPFDSLESYQRNKRNLIREKLAQDHIQYVSQGYDAISLNEVEVNYTEKGLDPRIVCDAVILPQGVSIEVLFQNSGQLLTPRKRVNHEIRSLYANFLFYTTPNLLNYENLKRANRKQEMIPFKQTHFDVLKRNGHCEFPLYNKAALIQYANLETRIERIRFTEGNLTINGISFHVCNQPNDEVYIITPIDVSYKPSDDPRLFEAPVGANRFNVVIVKDDIIAARYGDVLVPCVGVVVTFNQNHPLVLQIMKSVEVDEQGYVDVSGWTYSLELLPYKTWESSAELIVGGGLLLMQKGDIVYEESMVLEGWSHPLSIATQESDIQNLSIHPRTAIGMTYDHQLCVFVFSGRSQFSVGANYAQMCDMIKKMVPSIDTVMNVDGGASSFLAYVDEDGFVELNVPSATFDTCAGRVRNVYSMIQIKCKKENE